MKPLQFLSLLFTASFFLASCDNKNTSIEKSFYYWKTGLFFSAEELQRLTDMKIQKLYVKFFDVVMERGKPLPIARVSVGKKPPSVVEIIPVIFITNNTVAAISGAQIDSLAENISKLIEQTAASNEIHYKEIQVDCDWTLVTKEKYFLLLRQIKKKFPAKLLSCTIRLHQVKYFSKTGIPPVDRGMLMFYNMGDLQSMTVNSIFNEKNALKYVRSGRRYPLPLDVALPIFGWVKHFRDNKIIGLPGQLTETDLRKNTGFGFTSGHGYAVKKDMFYRGEYLQQGDLLIAEEVTPALAMAAARIVKKYFKTDSCAVVLYHWDKLNLSRYDNTDIENIYMAFD